MHGRKKKANKKIKRKKSTRKKATSFKKKVKRKTRRDNTKYAGLDGRFFSKIKQEYHDIDYADHLSDKDKEWLNSFMEEYLGARHNHKGKKIHKRLNTKKGRKKIFDPNNARNRDIYSRTRACGLLQGDPEGTIEDWQKDFYDGHDVEGQLIDLLDKRRDDLDE